MTIKEVLKKNHKLEIELLLAHVLKKPKEFVFLHPEFRLTRIQANRLTQIIKRRMRGEPIAYILGYKDFYGWRFKVDRNVLIPRSETEMGVDLVIERLKDLKIERLGHTIKILDIGTGSGCVIVSLAKGLRANGQGLRYEFCASDISKKALTVARRNARTHNAKIEFIQSDLLDNIKFDPDIIIANLPYLAPQWESKSIKHEPKQALYTKEKGLYLYRKLLNQISTLNPLPSLILLEFDPRQKADLAKLIKKYLPGGDIAFHRDFNGLWRYVEIFL